jgi:glycosyltransferase involved in cell wall biosynthesis
LIKSLARDETVAAYHAADIFLFPSNIECSPLVLFECLASKTPFLTSDAGNAVEIIRWSGAGRLLPTFQDEHGYARADVNSSAKALEDMVADSAARKSMAAAGFSAWRKRFTWDKISLEYESLYKRMLNARSPGAALS